jgi:diguanylate cyclase (GGDEF)-like protein
VLAIVRPVRRLTLAVDEIGSRRLGYPLCVALLDLDHFKIVNDTLGHHAGDQLLAGVSAIWRTAQREVDLLARWGGEEYVVALPDCGLDEALLVERLRAGTPGAHTCSAGVALWDDSESAGDLLTRADAALYEAKRTGRDRSVAAPSPAAAARSA